MNYNERNNLPTYIEAEMVIDLAIKAYNPFDGCAESLEILESNYTVLSRRMQVLAESMDAYLSGCMLLAPIKALTNEYNRLLAIDTQEAKLESLFILDMLTTQANY